MKQFIRIGVDLAKNSFQVHALENEEGKAVKRKLGRTAFLAFFSDVAPCLVGMEACGSAHYWARQLQAMGFDVRLIAPSHVKPYVKRGKTDAADAEAICEAVSRPGMRFVPVRSADNQAVLMLHASRELPVKQRTTGINALRGHLAEFGIVAAKGIGKVEILAEAAMADARVPDFAKTLLKGMVGHLDDIGASITGLDRQIGLIHSGNPVSQLLAGIPGIGTVIASMMVASVPDAHAFRTGRDFAAWLGLTPRLNSTGGKEKLGSITKQGNRRLRSLLVLGATSLLRVAPKHQGVLRDWLAGLLARKTAKVASVAMANKLARIAWAVMTTGEAFRKEVFSRA